MTSQILLGFLTIWAEKGNKPNRTRDFIYHLDNAFQKAKELGMMGIEKIRDAHEDYMNYRPKALEIAGLPQDY